MAIVGGAAIGAAGTIGAAAITSSKSGGGGGGGSVISGTTPGIRTPAFIFSTTTDPDGRPVQFTNRRLTKGEIAFGERFPRILGDIDSLRDEVEPGFGALSRVAKQSAQNARNRAIGDLKESLNRRRVLGSSFANDAIARVEGEFAQREGELLAEITLRELDTRNALIQQEFNFLQRELDRDLRESAFAADVSLKLQQILSGAASVQSILAARDAAGAGEAVGSIAGQFFGPAIQQGGQAFAGLFDDLLGPSSGGAQNINIGGPPSTLTIGNGVVP